MGTDTIHPAEAYLRNENNPSSLYVKIEGKRRRLFINRNMNVIGIIALGKRKRGYVFTNWASIEKIYYPSQKQEADTNRKLILKYQKLARLATHTNDWLRHYDRYTHRRQVHPAFYNRKILRNGEYAAFPTSHEGEEKFFLFPLRFLRL